MRKDPIIIDTDRNNNSDKPSTIGNIYDVINVKNTLPNSIDINIPSRPRDEQLGEIDTTINTQPTTTLGSIEINIQTPQSFNLENIYTVNPVVTENLGSIEINIPNKPTDTLGGVYTVNDNREKLKNEKVEGYGR